MFSFGRYPGLEVFNVRVMYVALFGVVGVLTRYFCGLVALKHLPPPFPFGTLLINVLGAFAAGVIYVAGVEKTHISEDMRIGIMVGFLGGFTTFSSYCLEAIRLIEDREYGYALTYMGLSTFLGLGSTVLGIYITRTLLMKGSL